METENEKKAIKYLDLKAINAPYEEEIKKEINQVVSSGWYLQGRCVKQFEKNYASFIGTDYCISCGNGLDALKLILMGEMAIGKLHQGDEILVPANTYIATILSITSVGLVPILVEPNPETLQIDENLIESNISYKTRGHHAGTSLRQVILDRKNPGNLRGEQPADFSKTTHRLSDADTSTALHERLSEES